MELNISMIDILKMLAVVALVIALLIPKKKDYEYNAIDKWGVVFNIVLSAIYIPLSIAGIFMIFFADNPTGLTKIQLNLLYDAIFCGVSTPLVSIVSILTSVVARKRGKRKLSFVIQFLPIVIFIIAIILLGCATIH